MTAFNRHLLNRRLALALMGSSMMIPPAAAATGEDARFLALSKRWLEGFLSTQPVTATQIGDHRFDGEIDDMSAAGRARRTALWHALLEELSRLDRAKLSIKVAMPVYFDEYEDWRFVLA